MPEEMAVEMIVNGEKKILNVPVSRFLLDVLRDELGLTGTKECCTVGECGACTVLINGRSFNSCLILAVEADGSEVTTIEGLAPAGELTPLQDAFIKYGAVQCGFCIPGMVISAQQLLDGNPSPTVEEVREGLSGNLCRCGGYNRMFEAILSVSKETS
jgi:carbon-monoxide dehydrogenase small subunit